MKTSQILILRVTVINPQNLAGLLYERYGLPVDARIQNTREGLEIDIIPEDIEHTIAFKIRVILGWRRLTAEFIPGNFAASLLAQMQNADPDKRSLFSVFAVNLLENGASLSMVVNGINVDTLNTDSWPANWNSLKLVLQKANLILEDNADYNINEALPWLYGFLGLCLSLLPIEQVDEQTSDGTTEGKILEVRVKRYERSKINRAACIQIHGQSCLICGFNFQDYYGDLGTDFIHVHHVVPLSEINSEYICNPAKDLIPVCPNCHAMLHRKKPVLTPQELSQVVEDHGRDDS